MEKFDCSVGQRLAIRIDTCLYRHRDKRANVELKLPQEGLLECFQEVDPRHYSTPMKDRLIINRKVERPAVRRWIITDAYRDAMTIYYRAELLIGSVYD